MNNQLKYNSETGRIELNGQEFHCGETLVVLIVSDQGNPEWIKTRMEYNHSHAEWYLVGLPGVKVDGLFAKTDDQ